MNKRRRSGRVPGAGPFEVVVDGASLRLGGPKQRVVLASLALAPSEVVSADAIVDAVWGNNPPKSALGVVRTYVSRLRQVLSSTTVKGAHLDSRPPGYVFRLDPEQVDARRFEELVRP